MVKKSTNLGKQDDATGHKWMPYSNPRNGRIQITACQHCGTMLAGALSSKSCSPRHEKNPIKSNGWIIKDQNTEQFLGP